MLTLAGNSIISLVTWGVSTILYFAGYFFSLLVMAAGYILNWTLALNSNILDNPAVQIGWKITRDISNLGFVFVIIIIAFSTILRMGNFQIKKALPRLIIAALLINFSLLIAAVFLDFAGVLMNFFFNSAYTSTGGDGGIALALTGALSLHGFLKTPDIATTAFTAFSAASLNYVASLIFLDIATVVGAITLMAIAFMFLVRYIIIGFLLIMLPAAILAWVVGGKGWGDWTSKFFQYTFFGPLAGFYIYIALKTSQSISTLSGSQLSQVISQDSTGVISNIASHLGSLIIMVAMLMYGLNLAAKQCEVGGKAAVGMAKGITKGWSSIITSPLRGAGAIGAEKLGLSRIGKGTRFESFLRPLRQIGGTAEKYKETHGGLSDIPSAMFEEMTGGYGVASRKYRLEEKQRFGKEDKAITALAKKQVPYDVTGLSEAERSTYQTEYDTKIKKMEQEISGRLNEETRNGTNQEGAPMERVTKEYDANATIPRLAASNVVLSKDGFTNAEGVFDETSYKAAFKPLQDELIKTIRQAYKNSGNNLENTKAIYDERAKIVNIANKTGVDFQKASDTFKKWDKNANSALQEIQNTQKSAIKAGNDQIKKETAQLDEGFQEIQRAQKIKEQAGANQIKKEAAQLDEAARELQQAARLQAEAARKQAEASKKFRDDIMKK